MIKKVLLGLILVGGWFGHGEAAITIAPGSGEIGCEIAVAGDGFSVSSQVRIDFGTYKTITTTMSGGSGTFSTTFFATNQPQATVVITAYDGTNVATKVFMLELCVDLPKTGQTTSYVTGDDGDLERGVSWPSPRFTAGGLGTVTDNLTGLMWTKNANLPGITKNWQGALDYVAGMNAGTYENFGYTDWRLPNINELESLINAGQANNVIWLNNQGFINVVSNYYWSASSYAPYTSKVRIVHMSDGNLNNYKKVDSYYVWPVRAGQ